MVYRNQRIGRRSGGELRCGDLSFKRLIDNDNKYYRYDRFRWTLTVMPEAWLTWVLAIVTLAGTDDMGSPVLAETDSEPCTWLTIDNDEWVGRNHQCDERNWTLTVVVDVEAVGSAEPIGWVRDGFFGFFQPSFFDSRFIILLNSQVELLSINVDAEEGSSWLHKHGPFTFSNVQTFRASVWEVRNYLSDVGLTWSW